MTSQWNSDDEKALWEASDNGNLSEATFCSLHLQVPYDVCNRAIMMRIGTGHDKNWRWAKYFGPKGKWNSHLYASQIRV